MESNTNFLVGICCVTYNHRNYIVDAMNGFTMQQTNFPFVAVIVDDASTDGEPEVISDYLEEHFDLSPESGARQWENEEARYVYARHKENKNCYFAVIFLKTNYYSQKKSKKIHTDQWLGEVKYIALCEGDDYWTAPFHLKKQISFLDENPQIIYSCCRYQEYNEYTQKINTPPNPYFDGKENSYFIFDRDIAFKNIWFTKTHTSVYRRTPLLKGHFKKLRYNRDVHFIYELLSLGKGVCHSYICGVYRINEGSTFGGYDEKEKCKINYDVYYEFSKATKDPIIVNKANFFYKRLLYLGEFTRPHNLSECFSLLDYDIAKLRIKIGKAKRNIISLLCK